ncbi:MAG: DNA primase [Oscillospiraceae bacterium]|nr:DNA primase [Oscillospiraceae bacterium]
MIHLIPESFIEDLKSAIPIDSVIAPYVALKRAGRNSKGLCPFHSEKTPSFTVYSDNGSYYCFGCGKGGDAITFIREVENLDYVGAIRFLAGKAGLTVPETPGEENASRKRARILEINREAARFYHDCLNSDIGKNAREYLARRGLGRKTIKRFGLGYAPPGWDSLRGHLRGKGFTYEEMHIAAVVSKSTKYENSCFDMFRDRIMFPIIDLRGGVIGFGGRLMDGTGPKYLNSPDTPVFKKSRNLFALNFAKSQQSDLLILGEGYMDVIAMHQAGFGNSAATLGTSLTEEQARLMARYFRRVVIAYDSDSAGQNAAKRAINILGQNDVSVSVLEMEGAKDPDEYIKKFGAQRFGLLVGGSKSAMSFELDKLKMRFDLDDPEDKVRFLNAFCLMMADVESGIMRDVYIGQITKELEVTKDRISAAVQSLRKKKQNAVNKRETHNLAVFAQDKTEPSRKRPENPNIGGYLAEENLIALLSAHPDFYSEIADKLKARDFFDEGHRQIYKALSGRIAESLPLDPIHFSAQLTPGQMSRYSHILAKGREIRFERGQATEYCRIIIDQKDVRNSREVGEMPAEEFSRYITSLSSKKK